MSKTIDEKVVEMRLDNSNFEKNASTSIGTLAKLKQSLNLSGASKGLEQINAAAGKVDMKGLGTAVETVTTKFSALQVMGVTALANITNSAVNSAKNFAHALTIAPVSDGFSEYEMTLNAVQTTMAGTGKTAKEVQDELKKLDEYADKTVYSTADMLNNLPKFTNAGVELEKATQAMIGIANATALAGGDAGKASIAFYNLGQAIGTGYLTRMDYNSINNAGIATMEWKNAMVDAAIAQGTLTKVGEDAYQAGNKTLTLQQLFIDGLQEQWATTDVMMKVFGDYGNETTAIGEKAYAAAQDIKTFSMMMDSLKATAGTGWKDTWQIMFGDLEQAKEFWTGLNNAISGVITTMADYRNKLLEKALGSPFAGLVDRINSVSKPIDTVIAKMENLDEIAQRVIRGDYKNTDTGRRQNLMADGYNWAKVQNKVNEILGSTVRHSEEAAQAELELYQAEHGLVTEGQKLSDTQNQLNKSRAVTVDQLLAMTDAELAAISLTDDEINALRELKDMCEKTGISMEDALGDPELLSGRTLLINSFKNAADGLVGVFKALKEAWVQVFHNGATDEEILNKQAEGLYNVIAAVHKFSLNLRSNDEVMDKLIRTFKGFFAAISIVSDIVGGGLKIAFKAVKALLDYFDVDILDITAHIGDALVKFREMTDVTNLFTKAIEFIVPMLVGAADAVKGWLDSFMGIPEVQKVVGKIKKAFDDLKNIDFRELGKNIIEGLNKGIGEGATEVITNIVRVAADLILKFCQILGIHSPSREFFEIGQNIIQGLVNGLQNGISSLWNTIKGIAATCMEFFQGIDWGAVFAISISAGMMLFIKKIFDVFDTLSGPIDAIKAILESCKDVVDSVDTVVKNFAKLEKAFAFNIRMDGIKTLAVAVAIMAGSVIALTFIDTKKLWNAVLIIFALSAILTMLALAVNKISSAGVSIKDKSISIEGFKTGLIAIAGSLLLVAAAVKLVGSMKPEEAARGFVGLVGLVLAIGAVFAAYGTIAKFLDTKDIDKAGGMLFKISLSMIILVGVAKLISGMTWGDMGKAAVGILGIVYIIGLLSTIAMIPGKNIDKMGATVLKVAVAMGIIVVVSKLIAGMEWSDMGKATVGMLGLIAFIGLLTAITMIPGVNVDKLGSTLMGISGAMLILSVTAKILAGMEWGDMGKALVGLSGLTGVVGVLIAIVQLAGKDAPKIAGTLLALSVSIGILAGVAMMLSLIDIGGLAKGVAAVGMLSSFMALMVYATRGASDCKANLIVMSIAIAVMTASVAALSLVDTSKLAAATIALSMLMASFALVAKMSGTMQSAIGNLIVMTAAVAVMAGVLYLLSKLPAESTIGAAVSLSIVMIAMSGALAIISTIGKFVKDALLGVIALLAMAIPMRAFVYILALMQNIDNAARNATVLIALVTAMSLMLIPLTIIGALCTTGAPYLGVTALLAMAIPMRAFVWILALMNGIPSSTANAKLLTDLMTTMTDLLVKISIVAPLAVVGVSALTALTSLMVGLGVLAVGVGLLIDKFPQIETFIDKGIPILVKLAHGIGEIVGNLVGGFVAGVATALPKIAAQLSAFMNLMQPFIAGVKLVDESVIKGAGYLSAAILLLTYSDLIHGIASFISGGFVSLGLELSAFIIAAQPFLTGIKLIDPSSIEAAKMLAEMILILTAANLIDGIASFGFGGSSIADFGVQIIAFGAALVGFSKIVSGNIDETAVSAAANAGKLMAEMASTIPNTGGLLAYFTGDNNIAAFGVQLAAFGAAIVGFSKIVAGNIDQAAVEAAALAGATMVELANTIPNTGGLLAYFTGDNNIAAFGVQLAAFGLGIVGFSNIVKGNIDQAAVEAAALAGATMVELANTIPKVGGLVAYFTGTSDMASFGVQLAAFGLGIKSYSDSVTGLNVEAISASATAASELAKLQNSLEKTGGLVSLFAGDSGLNSFGDNLKKFGSAMVIYSQTVASVDVSALTATSGSFKSLINMAKSADNVNFEGIGAFGTALKNLGKSGVDKFVQAFKDGDTRVNNSGKNLIASVITGAKSKEPSFESSSESVAKTGATAISDTESSFKSAGKDLGDGLIEGIEAKETEVYNAAFALGQMAVQGEKDGQASNSPSKLTIKAGKWLGEGLVIGIGNMTKAVYNAGYGLGDSAVQSVSSTISRIGEMISSDVDSQPTIRPVLDLSEVSTGVNALNGMLDTNHAVGLMANIRSIGALTNSRQNGNEEVISALNKLNKTMSNLRSGDTYNVNGITYSNGNEISEAVNVLVRATMMERRV